MAPQKVLLLAAAFLAGIAGVMMHSAAAQAPYTCVSWSAWRDAPPAPAAGSTLHVSATCTFRVAGYRVEVKPHLPAGADSHVLLMDLVVHAPAGPQVPAAASQHVTFSTVVASAYQSALILPDRIAVPVTRGGIRSVAP